MSPVPVRDTCSRQGIEGPFGVLLEEVYKFRFTRSQMLSGVMNIDWLQRSTIDLKSQRCYEDRLIGVRHLQKRE